jgi:hypothetical protein
VIVRDTFLVVMASSGKKSLIDDLLPTGANKELNNVLEGTLTPFLRCRCSKCVRATGPYSEYLPCWFMSHKFTAAMSYVALLWSVNMHDWSVTAIEVFKDFVPENTKDLKVSASIYRIITF